MIFNALFLTCRGLVCLLAGQTKAALIADFGAERFAAQVCAGQMGALWQLSVLLHNISSASEAL